MKKYSALISVLAACFFFVMAAINGPIIEGRGIIPSLTAFSTDTWDWTESRSTANILVVTSDASSGNDIGSGGGLSEANRTLTDASGNMAGAIGSPSYRVLDGSDDYYTWPQAAAEAMVGNANKTWTFMCRVRLDGYTNDGACFMVLTDGGGAPTQQVIVQLKSQKLKLIVEEDDDDDTGVSTTDSITLNQDIWIAAWADASQNVRAGFSTSRPEKWSDFESSKRVTNANNKGDFNGASFGTQNFYANTGGAEIDGRTYWVLVAKTCEIEND